MRRLITFLLALAMGLTLCACGGEAEAPTETVPEVTVDFRGIPFGTSYPEVMELLKSQGIKITEVYDDLGGYHSIYTDEEAVDVGGHGMKMHMEFTSMTDPKAKIEDSVLYEGSYRCNIAGVDAWTGTAQSLAAKLDNLYGQRISSSLKESDTGRKAYYRWELGDYEILIEGRYTFSNLFGDINITYSWLDGVAKSEANQQALKVPETTKAPNYNGL